MEMPAIVCPLFFPNADVNLKGKGEGKCTLCQGRDGIKCFQRISPRKDTPTDPNP